MERKAKMGELCSARPQTPPCKKGDGARRVNKKQFKC